MSGYGNDKELRGDRGGGARRACGGDVDVSSCRRRRSEMAESEANASPHLTSDSNAPWFYCAIPPSYFPNLRMDFRLRMQLPGIGKQMVRIIERNRIYPP